MPGRVVDICIGAREIRSGLRYGGKFTRALPAGHKRLRVFARDRRTCRGTKLAQKQLDLSSSSDLTVVVTKKSPKVVVFDNAGLGPIPAALVTVAIAMRNASDIAPVTLKFISGAPFPVEPNADVAWAKGDEYTNAGGVNEHVVLTIVATKTGSPDPIASPVSWVYRSGNRYEANLLGTSPGNARFVNLVRAVAFPVFP
jgi:hypothetical protein